MADISTLSFDQIEFLFDTVLNDIQDQKEKTLYYDEILLLDKEYDIELDSVKIVTYS